MGKSVVYILQIYPIKTLKKPDTILGIYYKIYFTSYSVVYILQNKSIDYMSYSTVVNTIRIRKMPSRIQIAQPQIVKYFDENPKRIFNRKDIRKVFDAERESCRLAQSMSLGKFIGYLVKNTALSEARFDFPNRPITRYFWGDISLYSILMTLKPKSYFCHYTAVYMHELTDQIPKTVNINSEQIERPRQNTALEQKRIDFAFKTATRMSKNIAEYKEYKIRLLNGKQTGNLGVIETNFEGANIHVTDIERTLIDIAVRPEYSGGVYEVLNAYKKASGRVSVNRLAATLKKINYIYPYHQVIGFYLDTSGVYKKAQIELLKSLPMQNDFYLAHKMKETDYSEQWRLYYPKGFR
jgi:hypothetical protein